MVCFKAMVQAKWLWNFISGLRIIDSIARPLRIYCDDSTTIFFNENDKSISKVLSIWN